MTKSKLFFCFCVEKEVFFMKSGVWMMKKSIKNFSEYRKNINFAKCTEKLTLWRKYFLITVTA